MFVRALDRKDTATSRDTPTQKEGRTLLSIPERVTMGSRAFTLATAGRSASGCAVSWNIAGIIFGNFKFAGLCLADAFN